MAGDVGAERPVWFVDGIWIDLNEATQRLAARGNPWTLQRVNSIRMLIESGASSPESLSRLYGTLKEHQLLKDVTIAAPSRFALPLRPGKVVAVGRNFAAHAKELGNAVPEEPILFVKSATACIGDGEAVRFDPGIGRVDHEAELAVVIGKRAKDVSADRAREFIAGYTLLNDVTARDMQNADKALGHPWFRSKNLDTFCPVGPVIALPDALPWPVIVDIELKVNGVVRQQGSTKDYIFDIPELIAYITRFMTLEPGDLIATGTPEGVGPVSPGDTMELSVSEIGILRNPVEKDLTL